VSPVPARKPRKQSGYSQENEGDREKVVLSRYQPEIVRDLGEHVDIRPDPNPSAHAGSFILDGGFDHGQDGGGDHGGGDAVIFLGVLGREL
jgi:hypothetical protein